MKNLERPVPNILGMLSRFWFLLLPMPGNFDMFRLVIEGAIPIRFRLIKRSSLYCTVMTPRKLIYVHRCAMTACRPVGKLVHSMNFWYLLSADKV
jgi:hypothetical protein